MPKRSLDAKADIKIRLTEGLRRNIEKAASQNGVSMNAEMIHRLDQSFEFDAMRKELQRLTTTREGLTDLLRKNDFRPVYLLNPNKFSTSRHFTMWAEPDVPRDLSWTDNCDAAAVVGEMQSDPMLIAATTAALASAIERIKGGGKK
jgi:hypothetical protein